MSLAVRKGGWLLLLLLCSGPRTGNGVDWRWPPFGLASAGSMSGGISFSRVRQVLGSSVAYWTAMLGMF
jgi:hypothetical protein